MRRSRQRFRLSRSSRSARSQSSVADPFVRPRASQNEYANFATCSRDGVGALPDSRVGSTGATVGRRSATGPRLHVRREIRQEYPMCSEFHLTSKCAVYHVRKASPRHQLSPVLPVFGGGPQPCSSPPRAAFPSSSRWPLTFRLCAGANPNAVPRLLLRVCAPCRYPPGSSSFPSSAVRTPLFVRSDFLARVFRISRHSPQYYNPGSRFAR